MLWVLPEFPGSIPRGSTFIHPVVNGAKTFSPVLVVRFKSIILIKSSKGKKKCHKNKCFNKANTVRDTVFKTVFIKAVAMHLTTKVIFNNTVVSSFLHRNKDDTDVAGTRTLKYSHSSQPLPIVSPTPTGRSRCSGQQVVSRVSSAS